MSTFSFLRYFHWGAYFIKALLIAAIYTLFLPCLHADYFNRHAEGWHFYEDRVLEKDKEPVQPSSPSLPKRSKAPSASEILQAFKAEVTKRLHVALIDPTVANIQAYQEIQKVMLDRAELFSTRWQEVVYRQPHLDYTVTHPISQVGRHLYLDQQQAQRQQQIQTLASTHGLFFFYRGDCPYCHQFAPIVKRFAETYGWKVLAISMDGSALSEFPQAQRDNGAATKLGVEVFPTLLAVEPRTGQVIPLSYGLSTQDQIEDRVRVLVKGDQ